MLVVVCLILHFISGLCLCIYFNKIGAWEYTAKYGDGIRFAKPADLVFYCIFVSEFYWLVILFEFIENSINSYFEKKYKNLNRD